MFEALPDKEHPIAPTESIAVSIARTELVKRSLRIVSASHFPVKAKKGHPRVNIEGGFIKIRLDSAEWDRASNRYKLQFLVKRLARPEIGPKKTEKMASIKDHAANLEAYLSHRRPIIPSEFTTPCKSMFRYVYNLFRGTPEPLTKKHVYEYITEFNNETYTLFKKHVLRDVFSDFEAVHLLISYLQSPPSILLSKIAGSLASCSNEIHPHLLEHHGNISIDHPIISNKVFANLDMTSTQILKMDSDYRFSLVTSIADNEVVFDIIDSMFLQHIQAFLTQNETLMPINQNEADRPSAMLLSSYAEQQHERYELMAHRPYIYAIGGIFTGLPACGTQPNRKSGERAAAVFQNRLDHINNYIILLDAVATYPALHGKKQQIVSWIINSCIFIIPTCDPARVGSIASSSYDRLRSNRDGEPALLESNSHFWSYKYRYKTQVDFDNFDKDRFL